jgi:two-component system NarL family sensor kinase
MEGPGVPAAANGNGASPEERLRGPAAAPRRAHSRARIIARAVIQFALPGLAALILVGLGAVLIFQHRGEQEALRDARQLTRAIGVGMIAPRLSDGLLTGDQAAIDRLDRFVDRRVVPLDDSLMRIKIWSPSGRIVYSDESRLIGSPYRLEPEEREAFLSGRVNAGLSDLSRRENRFERGRGRLLEVYLPIRTRSGSPLLFEVYWRYSSVAADARAVWLDFAPALVAALLLLWLVQLPLAWSLARRLQRGQREREALFMRAMEASDHERRRIAGNLHDGVVQDLAGVSLTLAAAAERTDDARLAPVLAGAASSTRHSIRQMRSLLVDIYPANLHTAGLQAALGDLLAPLTSRGLSTRAVVEDGLAAAPEVEQLVFRTAQEALRNVLRHADATTVELHAGITDGIVQLLVEDDGRGFSPGHVRLARADGHIGLPLLADRASALGGRLIIDSAPGRGTRVRLEVPAE